MNNRKLYESLVPLIFTAISPSFLFSFLFGLFSRFVLPLLRFHWLIPVVTVDWFPGDTFSLGSSVAPSCSKLVLTLSTVIPFVVELNSGHDVQVPEAQSGCIVTKFNWQNFSDECFGSRKRRLTGWYTIMVFMTA